MHVLYAITSTNSIIKGLRELCLCQHLYVSFVFSVRCYGVFTYRGNSVINSLAAVEEEKVVPVARPRLIHESSSIYEDKKDNKYQPQCKVS